MTCDNVCRSTLTAIPQQQPPTRDEYSNSVNMSTQADGTTYDPSTFGPQNFPQLQQGFYNRSADIDLGFSDFFGGYWDPNYTTS